MTRLSFAASFGPHMVLQQAPQAASVWGFAPASSTSVALTLLATAASSPSGAARVDAQLARFNSTALTWRAILPPIPAQRTVSGAAVSYSLRVDSGTSSEQIDDVLFGEVWVCS